MKLKFLVFVFLFLQTKESAALQCNTCSAYSYSGDLPRSKACLVTFSSTTNCSSINYCQTKIQSSYGLPTSITRLCKNPNYDEVTSTNLMPTSTKCEITSTSTTCYYSCKTDTCNKRQTRILKTCTTDCGSGVCNYYTGACECTVGYRGTDCSIPPAGLSCLQCNEEMDENCAKSGSGLPSGSTCPNSASYCVATKTSVLSPTDGKIVRTIVTRGCSSSAVYGCTSQRTSDSRLPSYLQFRCSESCQTDNCNVATPQGPSSTTYCVMCNDVHGCRTNTFKTLCPTGQNICYSTVEYLIGTDGSSSYTLLSVKRGCSAVETPSTGCTQQKLSGVSLNKVKCHENCKTAGCNTGWPARPKCVQCSGTRTSSSVGSCFLRFPSSATDCNYPYQERCYTQTRTISMDKTDPYEITIYRGCAVTEVNLNCNSTKTEGVTYKLCYGTCSKTGCNKGHNLGSSVQMIVTTLLLFASSVVF